jgi:ribosomal protein S27AE
MDPAETGGAGVEDGGGDAVCWLHRLCPECGAMPTEEARGRCWRCGAPLPAGHAEAGDAQSGGG